MSFWQYLFPPPTKKAKKPPQFTDREILEILIATLAAQRNVPEILTALRPGLVEGLNSIQEIIEAMGGKLVDPTEVRRHLKEERHTRQGSQGRAPIQRYR